MKSLLSNENNKYIYIKMSEEVVSFPILYGKSSSGKSKVWCARILQNIEGHGISEIKHGQKGRLSISFTGCTRHNT